MEGIKQKLTSLRNEEERLHDRSTELDVEIKSIKSANDQLNSEILGCRSSEQLLKMKLDSETARLKDIESKISRYTLSEISDNIDDGDYDREEELENQLNEARKQLRMISLEYDETILRSQHVKSATKLKEDRAVDLESTVASLETDHEKLMRNCNEVDVDESRYELIDQLEEQVRNVQGALNAVTDTYENHQREITRLDRLIRVCNEDLKKQRHANDALKKEYDAMLNDLADL